MSDKDSGHRLSPALSLRVRGSLSEGIIAAWAGLLGGASALLSRSASLALTLHGRPPLPPFPFLAHARTQLLCVPSRALPVLAFQPGARKQ